MSQRSYSRRHRARPARQRKTLFIAAGVGLLFVAALVLTAWLMMSRNEARAERQAQPVPCDLAMVGSSSIDWWETLQSDFAGYQVTNYGIAGADIPAVTSRFFNLPDVRNEAGVANGGDYIPAPATPSERPDAIVFYAGENDLQAGTSVGTVLTNFENFMAAKRVSLGDTPVYFISVKPTIGRWNEFAKQSSLNERVKRLAERSEDLTFVDVVPLMLVGGRPGPFYVADGVHMNAQGYRLWAEAVKRSLATRLGSGEGGACQSESGPAPSQSEAAPS